MKERSEEICSKHGTPGNGPLLGSRRGKAEDVDVIAEALDEVRLGENPPQDQEEPDEFRVLQSDFLKLLKQS